jgi:aryl-alcohol dehydrogenase-like predicted oxidoreductase
VFPNGFGMVYFQPVQYRRFGRSGYKVSEIGFGAWGIGRKLWVGAEDSKSLEALNRAADLGLNFIDTALGYGDGHSERLVGRFLSERKERIHVATKVPPKNRIWPAKGSLEEVFPEDHIVKCAESSLINLNVERIDLLQLHVWDPSWLEEEQWYETLKGLKEQGKIAHIGVSVNDHQPDSALGLVRSGKIDALQVIYNIFDQSPEEKLFPLCMDKQVGVIVRVPFDEGALTGSVTPQTRFPKKDWRNVYFKGDRKEQVYNRVQKLGRLLGEEARTVAELSLKFCLAHPAVSTVIPGMRSVGHVDLNLSVSGQPPLSREMVNKVREQRWDKNFYLSA